MEAREEFLKKLNGLVLVAKEQENRITIEEVESYFSDRELSEEQMELVFDYLLSQKVVVKGYIKVNSQEAEEKPKFTEEEKAYLKEYQEDLKAFKPATDSEREELFAKVLQGNDSAKERLTQIYLKEVVRIAEEMYQPSVFLGDLIQEGNVGLLLGVEMLTDVESADEIITGQIRQSMQMLLEEEQELSSRDKKMVEKVSMLDESIKNLTEELGRKVTIDELAVYMGVTEDEIEDILRLTGEDSEEEEEE